MLPKRNSLSPNQLLLPSPPLSGHLVLTLPLILRPEPAGLDLAQCVVVRCVPSSLLLNPLPSLPQQEAPDGSPCYVTRAIRSHLDLPLPGATGVPVALPSERSCQLMT